MKAWKRGKTQNVSLEKARQLYKIADHYMITSTVYAHFDCMITSYKLNYKRKQL